MRRVSEPGNRWVKNWLRNRDGVLLAAQPSPALPLGSVSVAEKAERGPSSVERRRHKWVSPSRVVPAVIAVCSLTLLVLLRYFWRELGDIKPFDGTKRLRNYEPAVEERVAA